MARCHQCGSPVHGEYCDACGAEVPAEPERVSTGRGRSHAAPAAAPRPRRTGALALGAVALFLAGGVAGYALARWQPAATAPVAAGADPLQPASVQAGIALDEGTRLLSAGERQAAAAELKKASRLWDLAREQEPDNLYVQTYAGLTAFYLGEAGRSVELLEQVLAQDPNYLWAIFNLAWIRQTTGDLKGAADLYQRYLAAAETEQTETFKYIEQPGLIDQQVAAARAALQSLGITPPPHSQP